MGLLSSKYAICPQCGEPINKFHRIQKCSITGDLCCTRCIVSGRFSPKIADKIPEEYRQRFRTYNFVPLIIMCTAIYWVIAYAWPSFVGWDFMNPIEDIPIDAIKRVGIWLLAFCVLYPISAKLPHLGTWMWYWWIEDPNNRKKVDDAIEAQEKGEYVSTDKVYLIKAKLINFSKTVLIEKGVLYYISILLNILVLALYYVIKGDPANAGTPLSAMTGILLIFDIIIALFVIWIAAGFYSKKNKENQKTRLIIEWLSWGYVLMIPLSTFPYPLSLISQMDITGELTPDMVTPLTITYQVCFILLHLFSILLSLYLTRLKPDFNWKENNLNEEESLIMKSPLLKSIKRPLKTIIVITLVILLFGLFIFSHELLMVDFAMFICVASYYLVGVYFVVIFAVLKLVKRRKKDYFKYKSRYWTFVKVSIIIVLINFMPTFLTVTRTNPDLEKQFDTQFGNDWESKISDAEYNRIPEVAYSMFDQYYGYDVPINAKYDIPYASDSPRFVKNGSSGEIIANGTAKYTELNDIFHFNAHLPAIGNLKVDFGDSETADVKYPVIIYVHGIGMDYGSGNANWSSQQIANMGFAVFDMEYGYTGWRSDTSTSDHRKGYDFPDTVNQVGHFTKFLETNADEYHADLNHTYFAGRSFGGWMAMCLGQLYNNSYTIGNYSSSMHVSGIIPYYPASDIPGVGSDMWSVGVSLGLLDEGAPYIRGSSNPEDENFNPEWQLYYPLWIADNSPAGSLAPVFGIQGTHDYLVPQAAMKRLQDHYNSNGHSCIAGFYPFASHGFDALHFSHYGQSIMYYLSRWLFLTH